MATWDNAVTYVQVSLDHPLVRGGGGGGFVNVI